MNKYFNHNEVETIRFGSPKSKTSLRIYNKDVETLNDSVKRLLLIDLRWGKEPDPKLGAIRVEFQVMRDHLRDQHQIITYEDLVKKRKSLCKWLTQEWFRITEHEPDLNHTERFGASKLWQKVIDAFDQWTGEEIEERKKRKINYVEVSQLLAQARGCIVAAIAMKCVTKSNEDYEWPETFNDIESKIKELFYPVYPNMIHDIWVKCRKIEAEFPFLKSDF